MLQAFGVLLCLSQSRPYVSSVNYLYVKYVVRQWGTSEDESVAAIATTDDESVIIIGSYGGYDDFYATKLDADGDRLWEWKVSHLYSVFVRRRPRYSKYEWQHALDLRTSFEVKVKAEPRYGYHVWAVPDMYVQQNIALVNGLLTQCVVDQLSIVRLRLL